MQTFKPRPRPSLLASGVVSFMGDRAESSRMHASEIGDLVAYRFPGIDPSPFEKRPTIVYPKETGFIDAANTVPYELPADIIPDLSRLLTIIPGKLNVAAWYRIDPTLSSISDSQTRYAMKLSVSCSQQRAGVHLAYALARVIWDGSRVRGREGAPRILSFSHAIIASAVVAVAVFDENAEPIYDLAARSPHARVTNDVRHYVVTTPDPKAAARLTANSLEHMWQIVHNNIGPPVRFIASPIVFSEVPSTLSKAPRLFTHVLAANPEEGGFSFAAPDKDL
ncbi:hypothetical protein PENSPDRAFT_670085 [Peniophora sp. CONT]|nr:hypothetical protein PENSPDRAFT_670085 [Peniophora sp. CONT]